ncbi:MAG: hypothetical protein JNJ83_22100 [Verrucomicrobiaceae bacterium]|nr:hypothetical protein [Verrucomicrobiaceae bacterium]
MNTSQPLSLSASSGLLSRRRFRAVASWAQIVAVTMMSVMPVQTSRAIYVPDEAGQPVWLALPGESDVAGALDDTPNENNDPAWMVEFTNAVASGAVSFWSGGSFAEDGVWNSYGGQWLAAVGGTIPDGDSDGLPDVVDTHPTDPTNNSFEFQGGSYLINNIRHAFRAGIYAGEDTDSNSNGLPDVLEDWFYNPSNHGTLQHWAGGTLLINGEWSTFDPVHYFADSVEDTDGDSLPDEIDPYPSDAWNNTYFSWPGGSFRVDGQMSVFPPADYSGLFSDQDADDIADVADPYPTDPSNNSAWWPGGAFEFSAEGVPSATLNVAGQWHAATAVDADGNGIPDDIDLSNVISDYLASVASAGSEENVEIDPPDEEAPSVFTWPESTLSFTIQNDVVEFQPTEYAGVFVDEDGDGIHDPADPFPGDPYNNNDTDGDGLSDSVELQYPGHLNPQVADAQNLRVINGVEDTVSYLDVFNNFPGHPLNQPLPVDETVLDDDGDGMPNVWEIANGLDPSDATDAAGSIVGDFMTNLEKYNMGLNPQVFVNQAQVEALGFDWNEVMTNHNVDMSYEENDWDNDGVSNVDEIVVFSTNHRNAASMPTTQAIAAAIIASQVSATTLMNFQSLVENPLPPLAAEEGHDTEIETEEEEANESGETVEEGGTGGEDLSIGSNCQKCLARLPSVIPNGPCQPCFDDRAWAKFLWALEADKQRQDLELLRAMYDRRNSIESDLAELDKAIRGEEEKEPPDYAELTRLRNEKAFLQLEWLRLDNFAIPALEQKIDAHESLGFEPSLDGHCTHTAPCPYHCEVCGGDVFGCTCAGSP